MGRRRHYTEDLPFKSLAQRFKYSVWPLIRGVGGLIDSMRLSFKALSLSAEKAMDSIPEDEQEQPSKFEKWIDRVFGDKFRMVLMIFASVIGVSLAIGLFFVLPTWLYNITSNAATFLQGNMLFRSVFEGVYGLACFSYTSFCVHK